MQKRFLILGLVVVAALAVWTLQTTAVEIAPTSNAVDIHPLFQIDLKQRAHQLPNCFTKDGTTCYYPQPNQQCIYGPCEFGFCVCQSSGTWKCYL